MRQKSAATAWLTPAVAFFLSAGLWTTAVAIFGFYPFGDRSIFITDMGQQYAEFHTALFDMIKNGDCPIFTWNTGLGINFVGIFAYYLASPFTPLMLLFERSAIPEALLLIISLKIALAGLTFSIFLRLAVSLHGVTNIIFSTLYALSSYTVVFFFNIMWLDAVVLLPLVILAVLHVVNKQKTAPLTLVLVILFVSNFYTAYMVGLYSFLVLLIFLWLRSQSPRENVRLLILFFRTALIAACLSAFLMIPTYFALKECQGAASPSSIFIGLNIDPLTLLSKFAWGSYDSVTSKGSANLYCGVLTVLLFPIWLLHTEISRREKKAGCALLAFLLLSMLFYPLDLLWHACENPVWFPSRYSFVCVFTVLACAARTLSMPHGITVRGILTGFSISAVWMVLSIKIPEWFYPKAYHISTGNLWITLLALAVYTLLLLMIIHNKPVMQRIGLLVLLLCVSFELTGSTWTAFTKLDKEMHFETRGSVADYMAQSRDLIDTLNCYTASVDDSMSPTHFYRIENSNAHNANDGLMGGYPSVSHYSSFSPRAAFTFLKNCGMVCTSGNKLFRYTGSTVALDAVLGIRYVYGIDELRSGYYPTGIQSGGRNLYANFYALPLAFFADKKMQALPTSEKSPFSLLNTLLSSLDGRSYSYYAPLTVTPSCKNGTLSDNGTRTVISTEHAAEIHFTIENPRQQNVLLYFQNNLPDTTAVSVNSLRINPNRERLVRGIIDLGIQPPGEVTVSLYASNKRWFAGLLAMSFDETAFSELIASIQHNVPQDFTVTQTAYGEPLLTGHITAPRDGTLFTSIPADKGWAAFIDGKKVQTISVGDAFVSLPITEGNHTFTLRFRSRGLTEGCILSAAAALLCVAWSVIRLIKNNYPPA